MFSVLVGGQRGRRIESADRYERFASIIESVIGDEIVIQSLREFSTLGYTDFPS